jgi:hypothetical protein
MRAKRLPHCALVCCALVPFSAQAADDATPAHQSAYALFNSFEVMCNLSTPDFERLSAQAAAMRMKVLTDVAQAPDAGVTMQSKTWVGMLATGPFALRAEKMSGPKGIATSCSIEGPVPDADAFRDLVINKLHLNNAPERHMVEGSPSYYWDNYAGNGMTLMIRHTERPAGQFVQVKLMNMVKNDS